MATFINKSNARTYTRASRPKEVAVSSSTLGEIPAEYENACRLCLDQAEVMIDIFDKRDCIIPLCTKIRTLLSIEVNEDDQMPNSICDECLQQLEDGYNFKKKCLANNVKLRQYLFQGPPKRSYFQYPWDSSEHSLSLAEGPVEKGDCTIEWDDQVPLACVILSTPDVTEPPSPSCSSPDVCTDKNSCEIAAEPEANDTPKAGGSEDNVSATTEPVGSSKIDQEGNAVESPADYGISTVAADSATTSKSPEGQTSNKQVQKSPSSNKPLRDVPALIDIKKLLANKEEDSIIVDMDEMPLAQRLQIESKGHPPLYRCFQCKKGLRSRLEYKNHRLKCILKVVCTECPKSFPSRSLMLRHMRTHTGERPFKCQMCVSAFSQKEILQRHIAQIHSENKPFHCGMCDKSFALYYMLVNHHKFTHSTRRQFKCHQCPKVFRHPSGLSRHMQMHNGTSYYCKVCFRQFNDCSSVKRHVKLYHLKDTSEEEMKMAVEERAAKMEGGIQHGYFKLCFVKKIISCVVMLFVP